jgi:hypothetical protein
VITEKNRLYVDSKLVHMSTRAESIRVMHPLFQAGQGGSIPTSALQLWVEPIAFVRAQEMNREWHSILPRFGTGFIKEQPFRAYPCFAAVGPNDRIYAVAIWSNPESRNLPQDTWLELRRMAVPADAPRNTASRMLRVMRILLHRSHPQIVRVISYQSKSVHDGTIYRADGWRVKAECKGDTWNRPKRARLESQQIDDRSRWERPIVGAPEPEKTAK